ncbi:MAG: AHH domain-containing protein, partial [Nitrospirota bacterium]
KLAWWERVLNVIPADKAVHLLGSVVAIKKFKSLFKDEEILETIVDAEKLGGHAVQEVRYAERIEEAGGQVVRKDEGAIKGFFKRTAEGLASRVHARSLAKNLEEANQVALPGHQPHHIVAWNDERAARAREILQQAGIEVDSAINGIWLLNQVGDETFDAVTRHRWVHTDSYYQALTEKLEAVAGDAEAVKDTLSEIKTGLAELVFTHNKKGQIF